MSPLQPPSRRRGAPPDERGWPLGAALGGWLAQRGLPDPAPFAALSSCWPEVAGTELAGHSRPLALRDRVLLVAVDHPALATEVRLRGSELVEQLRARAGAATLERVEVTVRATLDVE